MGIQVGEKVKIIDASTRFPWKALLVGEIGRVERIHKKWAFVEGLYCDGVWFALDCLEAVQEAEKERAAKELEKEEAK